MAAMEELGHPVMLTCTYRSPEEQDKLYAQGRTTSGRIVTWAKGGESPHNHRMAADLMFVRSKYIGPWELVGLEAKKVGLVWGGEWKRLVDKPHVERRDWSKYV